MGKESAKPRQVVDVLIQNDKLLYATESLKTVHVSVKRYAISDTWIILFGTGLSGRLSDFLILLNLGEKKLVTERIYPSAND